MQVDGICWLCSLVLISAADYGQAQFEIEPSFAGFPFAEAPQMARLFLFKPVVTIVYTAWVTSTEVTSFFTICTYSVDTLTSCAKKRQLPLLDDPPAPSVIPVVNPRTSAESVAGIQPQQYDVIPVLSGRLWGLISTRTITTTTTSSSVSTSSSQITCIDTQSLYSACDTTAIATVTTTVATDTQTVTETTTETAFITLIATATG